MNKTSGTNGQTSRGVDLRKLFDRFNSRIGDKLTCDKLYIVPAMRYWIDEEADEVVTSLLCIASTTPYHIKYIKFNPDLKNSDIRHILSDYLAQAMTIGDNWNTYIEYRRRCA